jgi:hypothetical protein
MCAEKVFLKQNSDNNNNSVTNDFVVLVFFLFLGDFSQTLLLFHDSAHLVSVLFFCTMALSLCSIVFTQ